MSKEKESPTRQSSNQPSGGQNPPPKDPPTDTDWLLMEIIRKHESPQEYRTKEQGSRD